MELELLLQHSSPPMSNDTEVNVENPYHVEYDVRRNGRIHRAPIRFKDY
jgi:hypothetical protein